MSVPTAGEWMLRTMTQLNEAERAIEKAARREKWIFVGAFWFGWFVHLIVSKWH